MSVHAEGVEETSADVEPKRRNRFSFAGQIPSAVAPGEQRREGLLLGADLLPQRLGENRAARIPPAHPSLAVSVDPDRHELVGLLDWKRAETERVDERIDRVREKEDPNTCHKRGAPAAQPKVLYWARSSAGSSLEVRSRGYEPGAAPGESGGPCCSTSIPSISYNARSPWCALLAL